MALGFVATTIRLRRETRGADPQKTEVPVQQVEEHRADGDTTDSRRIAQVPYDSGIHDAYERNRDIRQDAWESEAEYGFVSGRHVVIP